MGIIPGTWARLKAEKLGVDYILTSLREFTTSLPETTATITTTKSISQTKHACAIQDSEQCLSHPTFRNEGQVAEFGQTHRSTLFQRRTKCRRVSEVNSSGQRN